MKIPVGVSISRSSGKDGHSYRISFQDEISRALLAEVELTGEQFAMAITSHHVTAEARVGRLEVIGRVAVLEQREVTCTDNYGKTPEMAKQKAVDQAAKLLEQERPGYGWSGHTSDLGNHHRAVKDKPNTYLVTFRGHEPKEIR